MATQKDRITFRKVRAYSIISIVALLIVGIIVLAVVTPGNDQTDLNGTPSASTSSTPNVSGGASVAPTETATSGVTETPTQGPTATPAVTNPPVDGMYEGGYCQLDANNVNFRSDSSTDSEVIRKVKSGEVMIILNFNCGAQGDWTKVKIDNEIGYLKTEFLKKCTMNPEAQVANVDTSVNIRSDANASSTKVTELPLGEKVTIIRFVNSDWVQVRLSDDRTGYMMQKYLKEA